MRHQLLSLLNLCEATSPRGVAGAEAQEHLEADHELRGFQIGGHELIHMLHDFLRYLSILGT